MSDPWNWLAPLVADPAEAVRWACLLEATAPKVGNVYPGRSFENLSYPDFVAAAEISARAFANSTRFSDAVLSAVLETSRCRATNVNLGILLLLGPLVAADRRLIKRCCTSPTLTDWKEAVAAELNGLDDCDGANLFRAIASASAGGLGTVDAMDVNDSHCGVDVIHAMRLAADRDRIARQYAEGFADLLDHVVLELQTSIASNGDLLQGIALAHVRLLADSPDSLIARKNGSEVASAVQSMAQSTDPSDPFSLQQLDAALRTPDHRLNPGTTADLIAGGLYVLLRSCKTARSSFPGSQPAHDASQLSS